MATTSFRIVLALIASLALVSLSACSGESTSVAVDTANESEADHDDDSDHSDGDDSDDHDSDDDDHDNSDDHDSDDDDHDHDDEPGDHSESDHDDDASTGLSAHEHGTAELSVAWTEGDVAIDLISPAFNIFGFEYEAVSAEDQKVVADRTAALGAPGIMAFNAEAGCSPSGEVLTELEYEGSHSEIVASWLFTCDNPDEINQLDAAALFAAFPSLEGIDAQWVSASTQSAAELSPSAPTLDFE